jgi:CBS domain-containing protein
MNVGECMRIHFGRISPDATILEAGRVMTASGEEAIPVVRSGKLVGVIAERDTLAALLRSQSEDFYRSGPLGVDLDDPEATRSVLTRTVGDLMTTRLLVAPPDMPVLQAAALMLAKRVRRLPVVSEGELVGMVFARDIHAMILTTQAA